MRMFDTFPMERLSSWTCALVLLLSHGLLGQGLPHGPATLLLKQGTPVNLQLAQNVFSAHATKYDTLDFVVAKSVEVDRKSVV